MKVPLADLKLQYQSIKPEIDAAIQRILDSSQFILGDAVASFETAFAKSHHARHCVAVGSGTDALHLALWAAGVGLGDAVLTSPFTFIATVEAILLAGATPVFADIDARTFTITPETALPAFEGRAIKAIIPVHLYGQAAYASGLLELARRNHACVVEDACQAHLATEHGRFVGAFGDAACFSFYPGKNLGAYGEAGAVVTNDDDLAARLRLLRDHGQAAKYRHTAWGHNYRMDGLQGAVLGVKMHHLQEWTERRRAIAAMYRKRLDGIPGLRLPVALPECGHVYHLFVVCTPRREGLQTSLAEQGISTGIAYPIPLHLQPAFEFLGYREGAFPVAERIAHECLALPIYAEMSDAQVEHVCTSVRKFFSVR